MKTFLAWVGGIAIAWLIISGIWSFTVSRGPVPTERKAEAMALRAFVVYQANATNVTFPPPWTVADDGDTWTVSSESGLKAVIEKRTGNSEFASAEK